MAKRARSPVVCGRRSSVHRLRDGTFERTYHDTGCKAACRFRKQGAEAPPYLHRAMQCLCSNPGDIGAFAARCGVRESTAWCYVAQAVERWPRAAPHARRLVHPAVWNAVKSTEDRSGPLRTLAERTGILADRQVRHLVDAYAHVRVARLCIVNDPPPPRAASASPARRRTPSPRQRRRSA